LITEPICKTFIIQLPLLSESMASNLNESSTYQELRNAVIKIFNRNPILDPASSFLLDTVSENKSEERGLTAVVSVVVPASETHKSYSDGGSFMVGYWRNDNITLYIPDQPEYINEVASRVKQLLEKENKVQIKTLDCIIRDLQSTEYI